MEKSNATKLSYIDRLKRVNLTFDRQFCLKHPKVPDEFIRRAEAKMQDLQKKDLIKGYQVFLKEVNAVWEFLRKSNQIGDQPVCCLLAQGVPDMSGIEVTKSNVPGVLGLLTTNRKPAEIARWHHSWLQLAVNSQLQKLDLPKERLSLAQLNGIIMRAIKDIPTKNLPLTTAIEYTAIRSVKDQYFIFEDLSRGELNVLIWSTNFLQNRVRINGLLKELRDTISALARQGRMYELKQFELAYSINQIATGPEILGLDLPITLLAGIAENPSIEYFGQVESHIDEDLKALNKTEPNIQRSVENKAGPASTQASNANTSDSASEQQQQPLKKVNAAESTSGPLTEVSAYNGRIKISLSPRGTEAVIEEFDKQLLSDVSAKDILKRISQLIVSAKLDKERVVHFLPRIGERVAGKASPKGLTVARALPPMPPGDPILIPLVKNLATGSHLQTKTERLKTKFNSYVEKDVPLARVKFNKPGQPGQDIFGNPLPPQLSTSMEMELGEGVTVQGDQLLSSTSGLPIIHSKKIDINPAKIIKGDLNSLSGPQIFTVPTKIEGSVEPGTTIYAESDLFIDGNLRSGNITVQGSLLVSGGIITSQSGLIKVRGDLEASFIEKTSVQTHGAVRVDKAIIGCEIACIGPIYVNDYNGKIGGGKILCKKSIETGHLGLESGPTDVWVGVDWRREQAVTIRTKRLERMKMVQERERKISRDELTRIRPNSSDYESKKTRSQQRAQKIAKVLNLMKQHLEAAERKNLAFNQSAIKVGKVLQTTVKIKLGKRVIAPLEHSTSAVAVTTKRYRGQNIIPIEKFSGFSDEVDEGSLAY